MKKRNIIFLYIFVFIMSIGASFAWYVWTGADINVNVAFSSLDKYLDYRVVNIDESGNETNDSEDAVATKIEYQKKENATNLDVYGNIYLTISNPSSPNLFRASGFGWELYGITDGNYSDLDEDELISSGNFVGENVTIYDSEGKPTNAIPAAINVILSEDVVYIVRHVQPETATNVDVSNDYLTTNIHSESIAPHDFESGGGKTDELYIRRIVYEAGKIIDLELYSSIDKITGYQIINTMEEPSTNDENWISIEEEKNVSTAIESGYLVNLNLEHTMTETNNICIKNSNNNIYCKSIGIYNDIVDNIPSATLCANTTYNGASQQLTTETGGTGYTLTGINQIDAGQYTITATLNSGYEWSDNTVENKTFNCTMSKKEVTITAGSSEKVYDGTPLTNSSCSATGLIDGHTATCTMTSGSTITNAGSVNNVIDTTTVKSGITDVTLNYDITKVNGTLTITKKSISDATITFDSTDPVYYDGTAKQPNITVKDGSTTLTKDTDYTVTYSNNTNVGTATVTVTGKGNYKNSINDTFTISYKTYTITLDQAGGTGGTTTLYGRYADGIYLNSDYSNKMSTSANPITKPTLTGNTFGGYYTNTNGAGTQMINANGYITSSFTNKKYNENVTLNVKWNADTYQVKYNNVCSLTSGGTMANSTHEYGVAKNLTANAYTCSALVTFDYQGATSGNTTATATASSTFNGWATTSGGEKVYNNQESVTNLATSGTVNLYTNWTNSGTVTLPTPSKSGHIFNGWYDAASGGNKVGVGGATYTPTEAVTLYAQWTEAIYMVTNLDSNGNTSNAGYAYASSLSEALEKATTTYNVILALEDNTSGAVTINKNVVLDTNGKTITLTVPITVAEGYTLKTYGSKDGVAGTITANSGNTFINNGTLTIENGNIINTSSSDYGIINNGTLTLNGSGVNIQTNETAIRNNSAMTMTNATIDSGNNGITCYENSTLTVNSGTINAPNAEDGAIWSGTTGTINIAGGTLTGPNAVSISTGTLNITGGTLTGSTSYSVYSDNTGIVNINGATLISSSTTVVYVGGGTTTITSGTIQSTDSECDGGCIGFSASGGITNIDGGTYNFATTGYHVAGVYGGTLNYGQTNTPYITSSNGIYVGSGNLNFKKGTLATTSTGTAIEVNSGTINISGGSVRSIGRAIQLESGTLNMTGGTIETSNGTYSIFSYKTVGNVEINISGGNITTSGSNSNFASISDSSSTTYSTTINISGGTIESTGHAVGVNRGSVTNITGGTLNSNGTVPTVSTVGTLYLGIADSNVSTTSPIIYGSTNCNYPPVWTENGTWNYYDGVIYWSENETPYSTTPNETPTGFTPTRITDENYGYKTYLSSSYKIQYDCGDGTGIAPATQTINYGDNVTIASNTCTAPNGYKFANWATTSGITSWTGWSGIWEYINGDNGIENNTLNLTAQWEPNIYTVNYYNGSTKIGSSTHDIGTEKNLTTWSDLGATITNSTYGWSFAGWSSKNNSTSRDYTDGQSVTNLSTTPDASINLYAVYSRTVILYYGIAKASNSEATQYWNPVGTTNGTYVTGVASPASDISYTWEQIGYRNDTTASSKEYNANTTIYPSPSGSRELYSVYSREITVYSGVSKETTTPLTQYYNSAGNKTSVTLPSSPTAIPNWEAIGYRTTTAAATKTYSLGGSYNPGVSATPSKVYAVYSREIRITYDPNTGSGNTPTTTKTIYLNTNSTTTSSQNITLATNEYTRDGYSFAHWSIDNTKYEEGASYTPNLAYDASSFIITAYAQWSKNVYELYNSGGTSQGYVNTLTKAITNVPTSGTIKALVDDLDGGAVTISKTFTLNTNGKTITMTGSSTISSGTVTLTGSGTITSAYALFTVNSGATLTLNGPTVSNTAASSGSTAEEKADGIKVTGTLNIKSGTLTGDYPIHANGGTVSITGGTVNATGYAIRHTQTSNFTFSMSGGTINVNGNTEAAPIYIQSGSKTVKVTISAGTLNSTGRGLINEGTASTINITGGEISTDGRVIDNSGGTLTIGTNDSTVSTTSPLLRSSSWNIVNSTVAWYLYDGALYTPYAKPLGDDGVAPTLPSSIYKTVTVSDTSYTANGTKTYLSAGTTVNGYRVYYDSTAGRIARLWITTCESATLCYYSQINGLATNHVELAYDTLHANNANSEVDRTKLVGDSFTDLTIGKHTLTTTTTLTCRAGANASSTSAVTSITTGTSVTVWRTTTKIYGNTGYDWFYYPTSNCYLSGRYLSGSQAASYSIAGIDDEPSEEAIALQNSCSAKQCPSSTPNSVVSGANCYCCEDSVEDISTGTGYCRIAQ